jgi:signal transduction histidine kinase
LASSPDNSLARRRHLIKLSQGESLIASVGLGGALLMLCAIGLGGWWTLHTNRQAAIAGREQQLRALATATSDAASQMLANQEVSALKANLAGLIARFGLSSAHVSLPGDSGAVIADGSASASAKPASLPDTWSTPTDVPADVTLTRSSLGSFTLEAPVVVPGRGTAILHITDNTAFPLMSNWRVQAGIGAIGAGGMAGVLFAYRFARRRFRALGAIHDALDALSEGEQSAEVLSVSAAFGPEAQTWNRVLGDLTALRQQVALSKADTSSVTDRRSGSGDLLSICDAMWQGLVLVDDNLAIRYINGAGAVFLRGKRDDMTGKPLFTFLSDAKAIQAVKDVAAGVTRSRISVEITTDDDHSADEHQGVGAGPRGGSVLRFSVRPVRREDSAAAILVIEDVTQQRVADESRQAFVASATHELRTPLTNVRLYVDSLLEDPAQDPVKRSEAMNMISTEVRRLERMVGDLLSVAQIEAGQLKLHRDDVRLEPIFEELKVDFAEQAKRKDIGLRWDLPPKWPQIEGDRDKIVMALHNLIGNAIKYTPAGGQVTVKAAADSATLAVDVADNGIGIKDEEQPLVFEKFYRAKDRRIANVTGTGLGLAIAREVVRLHGGDISLKSQVDKGSTFTMTLPAKAA